MNHDLSYLSLIQNASVLVQLVMLSLLLASVLSWAMIYSKWRQFNEAKRDADEFEDLFWTSADASAIYKKLHPQRPHLRGLERIFEAGFAEYGRLHQQTKSGEQILDGAQRAMKIALSRETDVIENKLPFLATVGSTSPYIGLFGTVWGIMNSFRALGGVQTATLSMVAPGIAEALIATAMGLFAAIPAVIAFNRFSTCSDQLLSRYDNFMEEFSTLLQRKVYSRNN